MDVACCPEVLKAKESNTHSPCGNILVMMLVDGVSMLPGSSHSLNTKNRCRPSPPPPFTPDGAPRCSR
jgi:hypothetical protein